MIEFQRVIILFVITSLIYAEEPQNYQFKLATEVKDRECKIAYKDVNNNKFITREMRKNICVYHSSKSVTNEDCYVDIMADNPCELYCFQNDAQCSRANRNDNIKLILIGDQYQCGPNHYCNANGCCDVKTAPPIPPTNATIPPTNATIPPTNATIPPTNATIPPTNATIPPTNATTPSTPPTNTTTPNTTCKENEYFDDQNKVCEIDWNLYISCSKVGHFINPYNCHKFYECYHNPPDSKEFRVGFKTCGKDEHGQLMVWSDESVTCIRNTKDYRCNSKELPNRNTTVQSPTPTITTTTPRNPFTLSTTTTTPNAQHCYTVCEVDWKQYISCTEEGFFRNPYDCHQFYRCYRDNEMRIAFTPCGKDQSGNQLVWDNPKQSCVRARDAEECHNLRLPDIHSSTETYTKPLSTHLPTTISEAPTTTQNTTIASEAPITVQNNTSTSEAPNTDQSTTTTSEGSTPIQNTTTTSEASTTLVDNTTDVQIDSGFDLENDHEYLKIYTASIPCREKGWFRNPFDCHKLYECFDDNTDSTLMSKNFYMCRDKSLVFSEEQRKCVLESNTKKCMNAQLNLNNQKLSSY